MKELMELLEQIRQKLIELKARVERLEEHTHIKLGAESRIKSLKDLRFEELDQMGKIIDKQVKMDHGIESE